MVASQASIRPFSSSSGTSGADAWVQDAFERAARRLVAEHAGAERLPVELAVADGGRTEGARHRGEDLRLGADRAGDLVGVHVAESVGGEARRDRRLAGGDAAEHPQHDRWRRPEGGRRGGGIGGGRGHGRMVHALAAVGKSRAFVA
jgi:hypothetical protein